jgi:hypothetical protein
MTTLEYTYTILDIDIENLSFVVSVSSSVATDGIAVSIDYKQLATVTDLNTLPTSELLQERIHQSVFPIVVNMFREKYITETDASQIITDYLQGNLNTPVSGYVITQV